MKQPAIKYFLCDVHGVLTDGQERKRFLATMAKQYGMDYEQHNALWEKHIDNLDRKTETAGEYLQIVNKTFRTKLTVKEYFGRFVQEIKVNTALLQKLQLLMCRVCIASDNVPAISAGLSSRFGPSYRRYRKFYSFQLGLTKKEGMLLEVLKLLNAQPSNCLFIDDSSKNIQVAQAMGIKAILFTSNQELFPQIKTDCAQTPSSSTL